MGYAILTGTDPRLVCGRGRFQVRCLLCGGTEPRYVRFQHHRPPEEDREPADKPQVRSCSKAPAPCVRGLFAHLAQKGGKYFSYPA